MRRKAAKRRPAEVLKKDDPFRSSSIPAVITGCNRAILWTEIGVCLTVTLLAVVFHIVHLRHAGALWRDETQMVNISQMPTFADVWKWIEIDTFPLGWPMTVRAWTAIGWGASDIGLHMLGLVVGLSIIAMIWWSVRQFDGGLPLVAIALFALNPTVFVYGDSLRGYGLGVLTILFMLGAVWRVVREPTPKRIGLGLVAAVLAVQCMYFNAVLLLALGAGGIAVSLRRRDWKPGVAVIGIGMVAACSVTPFYFGPLTRQFQWYTMIQAPAGVPWLFGQFKAGVTSYGDFMIWVWLGLFAISLMACGYRLMKNDANEPSGQKDAAIFLAVILVLGPLFYFAFIYHSRFPSRPWYYLGLLAFLAVACDCSLQLLVGANRIGRWLRIAGVVIIAIAVTPGAWQGAYGRLTNVDLIAHSLEEIAGPDDMILVTPWWAGVTFTRYYRGVAPWTTLPNLPDLWVHRFDEEMQRMAEEEPIRPTLEKIAKTLSSGHRLYIVGGLAFLSPGEKPAYLPPIPRGPMSEAAYMEVWSRQTAYLLQTHALRLSLVPVATPGPVCPLENMNLLQIEGWH